MAFRAVLIALASLFLALSATASHALESRLKTIAETGRIRIGYGKAAPFSYVDGNGEVTGYSIEICRHVVEDLRQALGLAHLDVEFTPLRPQERMHLLRDGTVDIECGASTNTPERNRGASFALSHFFASTRFVALSRSNLTRIEHLKGRGVALPLGTANIADLQHLNRERHLDMLFVPVDGLKEGLELVGAGKVSAYAMDDVLLAAMVASSADPSAYAISDELVAGPRPYGFMLPLDDRDMKDAVDTSLRRLYASPEMAGIYERWFTRPIPSLDIDMKLPMSETLKAWFADPNPAKLP